MDIRLVRGRESRVWLWVGLLAGISIAVLIAAAVFGDQTMSAKRQVGAAANFGADRAEVLPMQTEEFETLLPLDTRELGRLANTYSNEGRPAPLVTPPALRVGIRRLIEPVLPGVPVLSLAELPPQINLDTIASWELKDA